MPTASMTTEQMTAQIAKGNGFIAALDQSGGSTPKALKGYGIEPGQYSGDDEMFGLIHEMRCRIIRSKVFNGSKVIGAILFERTMDGSVDGVPVPQALIAKGVVPFIKIDKGLEDEANGVQLMKPMPDLDALLAKSKALGVFGTKERSVIQRANREGIAAIVAQQFEVGQQVIAAGLMPILEPEVNIKSPERAEIDQILLEELLKALNSMPGTDKVMLKLSLPVKSGLFDPLVAHPRVLRVVALSGGYARGEACAERGVEFILGHLHAQVFEQRAAEAGDDAVVLGQLGAAIDEIHCGSTQKTVSVTA
jgi:fructose-bisphosphate aldolase class I